MTKQRYKVLEMDVDGNLYLHKSALLCENEIIKRLTEGTYRTEPIIWHSQSIKEIHDEEYSIRTVER